MKLKCKIFISGQMFEIEGESLAEINKQIYRDLVYNLYRREVNSGCNKTSAVLNVTAILDIAESTVWKVIGEKENGH